MLNEKGFNATLVAIKKQSEGLAQAIHDAGMFAVQQVNEHGNIGFGVRLIEAMGKKHDAQRVVNWLVHYGKFGVKKGEIVFKARKDITPATIDAFITKANENPYWVHTPQKKLVERINYLTLLESMVNKHKAAQKKIEGGEQVEELNAGLLPEIEAIIAKMKAPGVNEKVGVQQELITL